MLNWPQAPNTPHSSSHSSCTGLGMVKFSRARGSMARVEKTEKQNTTSVRGAPWVVAPRRQV